MIEFSIIDEADQQFATILNQRRVTLRLRYNPVIDRWSMDLSIDDQPVLHGRRVVTGVDLLETFDFGVGSIFAYPTAPGLVPNRTNLPGGIVRFYHATEQEIAAAIEA